MNNHLVNHIHHSGLKSDNTLHVIGVISNPVRYHSRYRLFRQWREEMLKYPNVKLHVVEAVYGDRQGECHPDEGQNHSYLPVNIHSEIWIKENLINLGIRHLLPTDWKYVAWVDCDVHFRDPSWALSSIHQLQHYNIIQPWSDAVDLDFYGGIHKHFKSFGSFRGKGKPCAHHGKDPYAHYGHSGFAWACTRYFYENVGKLAEFNPVGAGDHLMAWACIGKVDNTMPTQISLGYKKMCEEWEAKATYACAKMVGFTPGRIEHHFHGNKENRQYWNRWNILTDVDFDPITDLAYDSQGVMQVIGPKKYLIEQALMLYNRGRQEDSF